MFILTQFSFAYNPAFYFNMGKKLWRHRSFSSTCYSVIIGNILITIIIFARYHLLVASNSTFMTDFYVLSYNSDLSNLNEHYYYLISPTSVIWQINANCSSFHSLNMLYFHIRPERLKLICWVYYQIFLKVTLKQVPFPSFSYPHMYVLLLNLIAIILVSFFKK